jgi:ribosomal protein S18 acetylase RimI-like enzyme
LIQVRCLGPGTELPSWIEALDKEAFGDTWGPLDDGDLIFAIEGLAFIRWRAVHIVGEAELIRLAVAPEARRQGLARKLLVTSEKSLKVQGLQELHLEVRSSNTPARNLYEAQGWKLLGVRKAYYRDGEDAALYRREI